ncbi:MAG: type II toxin-antitoxin system RelE/ParE family toxin [Candidatus Aminicenantes bacterium]|nr:type II toxin-antitoxin system RelE/ParE family toxin [Candidatus Aminicenantes bacterium]
MSKKNRILKIYSESNGKEPFTDWLESLKDGKIRSRIYTRLDRLETGSPGDYRHLGEGIFELRLHFGPGFRIYYGEDGPVIIILLIGGDKSTQSKDIKKAMSLWRSFKEAKNEKF